MQAPTVPAPRASSAFAAAARLVSAGAAALVVVLATITSAHAATFTVATADDADDGTCNATHCSLREAIDAANDTGVADAISFADSYTIAPTSVLPEISAPVRINAPPSGACLGTTRVALDGDGAAFAGLTLGPGSDRSHLCRVDVRGFQHGIEVESHENRIEGSRIGTSADGESADPNSEGGILVDDARDTIIGGTSPSAVNVISGNGGEGINLLGASTGTLILGNLIGLDKDGTAALPNGTGVLVQSQATGTVVGGAGGATARNVISGNTVSGVTARAGTVIGNYIGTDITGTVAVPNVNNGVKASGPARIGGAAAGERNIISGNGAFGLFVHAPATIQGNWVGPAADGSPLGGQQHGVHVIAGAEGALIGGTAPTAGNVISGNVTTGIVNVGAVAGFTVQGNVLGLAPVGSTEMPNGAGIALDPGSTDVLIGGSAAGAGNTIAANGGAGVAVAAARTLVEGNTIAGNGGDGILVEGADASAAILANDIRDNGPGEPTELGIDVLDDGISPNDAGDADGRPNFPVLGLAETAGATATVTGTIDSVPGRPLRLELFASRTCDEAGNGQGETFLGAKDVTAGAGATTFSVTVAGVSPGSAVTATATDLTTLETSEFSACRTATLPTMPSPPPPPPPPPPATPQQPSAVLPTPAPAPASLARTSRLPPKIRVLRARVDDGVLRMLVGITGRASGRGAKLALDYRSSGRRTRFTVPIASTQIKIRRKLPASQPKDTGIVTLRYAGNAVVAPDRVRLRAADGKARLVCRTARIEAGELVARGTIVRAAAGVVRIRLGYQRPDRSSAFLYWNARIANGTWAIEERLPAEAAGSGQLSIRYAGSKRRGLRGEQIPKRVLPG